MTTDYRNIKPKDDDLVELATSQPAKVWVDECLKSSKASRWVDALWCDFMLNVQRSVEEPHFEMPTTPRFFSIIGYFVGITIAIVVAIIISPILPFLLTYRHFKNRDES